MARLGRRVAGVSRWWVPVVAVAIALGIVLRLAYVERLERLLHGVKAGVTLEGHGISGYLRDEVVAIVSDAAIRKRVAPVDATIDKETGKIAPERSGLDVDVEATVDAIMAAPAGGDVEFVLVEVGPSLTRAYLETLTEVISCYATVPYGSPGRLHNIRLSTATINNTIVVPDAIFSFNEVVGPRTMERGYQMAPVLMGGRRGMAPGGGVCQVSTTLYNAALEAGMEILERHPHSLIVRYVPVGRDASVLYGYADMKWRNTLRDPVIVKGGVSGGSLYFMIVGRKPSSAR